MALAAVSTLMRRPGLYQHHRTLDIGPFKAEAAHVRPQTVNDARHLPFVMLGLVSRASASGRQGSRSSAQGRGWRRV